MGSYSSFCDSCLSSAPGSPMLLLADACVLGSLGYRGKGPLVFSLPPHCSSAGRFWVTAAHQGPCLCSFPVRSGLWPSASLAVSHADRGLFTPSLTQRPSREDIRGSSGARSQPGNREQYSLRRRPGALLRPKMLSLPSPPSTSPGSPANHRLEHPVQTCSDTSEARGHCVSPE